MCNNCYGVTVYKIGSLLYANQVMDIQYLIKDGGRNIESDDMEEKQHESDTILVDRMFHISGKLNIANIATRRVMEITQTADSE